MCSISITSVIGVPMTPTGSIVTVSGTVTDCITGRVTVKITCAADSPSQTVSVNNNAWTVDVNTKCLCGDNVTITAVCPDNPQCSDTFVGPIPCNVPVCCPQVTTTVTVGDCDVNGNRPATFTTTVIVPQGCTPTVVERNFGDGTTGTAQVFNTSGTFTYIETHTYSSGNYTSLLNVIVPTGCPISQIPVTIRECPPGDSAQSVPPIPR
jgi:hypothetical protein